MYSPERYEFKQGQEQVAIYKVQDLEVALQKAMQNISELQSNLSFMIKYNEELKQDQASQQRKYSKTIQQLQTLLSKKDRQILSLKQKHNQYQLLLSDTKLGLDQCRQSLQQKQQLIERQQRIIHQLKTTVSSLQDEILNNKYNEVSIQSNQSCYVQLQDYEKQLHELEYQNKRLQGALEKENRKVVALEKENNQFKAWLGDVVGVRKVVNGCEKILMNQIARKLGVNV